MPHHRGHRHGQGGGLVASYLVTHIRQSRCHRSWAFTQGCGNLVGAEDRTSLNVYRRAFSSGPATELHQSYLLQKVSARWSSCVKRSADCTWLVQLWARESTAVYTQRDQGRRRTAENNTCGERRALPSANPSQWPMIDPVVLPGRNANSPRNQPGGPGGQ